MKVKSPIWGKKLTIEVEKMSIMLSSLLKMNIKNISNYPTYFILPSEFDWMVSIVE